MWLRSVIEASGNSRSELPPGLTHPDATDRPVAVGYRGLFVLAWVRGDAYISVHRRGHSGRRLVDWMPAPEHHEWDRPGRMDQFARSWVAAQRNGIRGIT